MELTPFIKTLVEPGEPLTAQAWNDIVDAVDVLHQFLASRQHVVRVRITNPGIDREQVRVVATRAEGAPVAAVAPVPPGTDHLLAGLEAGAWTIVARAPGFEPASAPVTVEGDGETTVELAMVRLGAPMPDLFGQTLRQAADTLDEAGIPLIRVLDFTGRDLPPSTPDPDDAEAPVLVQWPAPGTTVATSGGARLVIATPVAVEQGVEVPSLAGLTQAEAQRALEAVGLVLGRVTTLQSGS